VLVVIITDGEENASRLYHGETIKSMVKTSESDADWTFTFLGANVDAFKMGATFGMNSANTASYATTSMSATMNVLRESTTKVRMAKSAGVSTAELYATQALYNAEDRARMTGDGK
jgi:predicted peroxiredoxin